MKDMKKILDQIGAQCESQIDQMWSHLCESYAGLSAAELGQLLHMLRLAGESTSYCKAFLSALPVECQQTLMTAASVAVAECWRRNNERRREDYMAGGTSS